MNPVCRYLLIAIAGASSVGCVSMEERRAEFVASLPVSERAYVIGKYSVDCRTNSRKTRCRQPFNSIGLAFSGNEEPFYGDWFNSTVGGFGGNTVHDYVDFENKEMGYYFCRILPPGSHNFYSLSYWNFANGGSGFRLGPDEYFDVPFTLEVGQISVLGKLKVTTSEGRTLLGAIRPIPGGLEISPMRDDEIELALEKCPEAAEGLEVISLNIWDAEYPSPFVQTIPTYIL